MQFMRSHRHKLKNGISSAIFQLTRRGTRLGCPLSPLLFALSLKAIKHNINIKGIKNGR